MQLNIPERIARRKLFSKIEAVLLPDAESRIGATSPFEVESVLFGSKPKPRAYGKSVLKKQL